MWLVLEALKTKLKLGLYWELAEIAHSTSSLIHHILFGPTYFQKWKKKFNYIHLWPFIESWTNHIWGFWNPWPVWGELSLLQFHFTHVAACEDLYWRSHSAQFCYGQQLVTGWIQGLRPQYPLKSLSEDSSCASKKPCQRRKGRTEWL